MDYIHSLDPHTVATVFAIGTAFIPLVGPFISAGIGLADAALYYKEGDKTSAGITAAFSMIPFIGMIPGVKELGSKAMAALGSKVAKGIKVFTPAETKVLNAIKQNEATIKKGLESAGAKLTPVVKSVESLKPAYVKRFGQESYDNLLRDSSSHSNYLSYSKPGAHGQELVFKVKEIYKSKKIRIVVCGKFRTNNIYSKSTTKETLLNERDRLINEIIEYRNISIILNDEFNATIDKNNKRNVFSFLKN
jgi:hypothetical protein